MNIVGDTIVDLSHTLEEGIPSWPTHAKYFLNTWERIAWGSTANNFEICMGEHNGTHIDASYHFFEEKDGGVSIEKYPVGQFMGPCVKIDFCSIDVSTLVSRADIEVWEKRNNDIKQGSIVLFNFGWDDRFKPMPEGGRFIRKWPGISKCAAQYLVEKNCKMIGVDTFAIDASFSTTYEAHRVLLSENIPIAECLANLGKIPNHAWFIGLPLPFKGGSGSPIRAIAIF